MIIAQLLASPFYGGPERQVLGLSRALRPDVETKIFSYREGGKANDFLSRCRDAGFESTELDANWPHFFQCRRELAERLKDCGADLLCTNGYKPDILGIAAARAAKIPAVSIAHGWTGATRKVRINEGLDKFSMRFYDKVIGVSQAQSDRVVRAGVAAARVITIHNGVDPDELGSDNPIDRQKLAAHFSRPPRTILVAAGRLSPEKGFDLLIKAAALVKQTCDDFGVLIFGGGPLESDLREQIVSAGVEETVVLGGFTDHLDTLLPQADGFVLCSRTEGLPVILLEAMGSGVASVATSVGGVPEVIRDGHDGLLVKTEDITDLAKQMVRLISEPELRSALSASGRQRVSESFTHRLQAERFLDLAGRLTAGRVSRNQ